MHLKERIWVLIGLEKAPHALHASGPWAWARSEDHEYPESWGFTVHESKKRSPIYLSEFTRKRLHHFTDAHHHTCKFQALATLPTLPYITFISL